LSGSLLDPQAGSTFSVKVNASLTAEIEIHDLPGFTSKMIEVNEAFEPLFAGRHAIALP
jgi:hypothetical protein